MRSVFSPNEAPRDVSEEREDHLVKSNVTRKPCELHELSSLILRGTPRPLMSVTAPFIPSAAVLPVNDKLPLLLASKDCTTHTIQQNLGYFGI
jgi:hypothetical protein